MEFEELKCPNCGGKILIDGDENSARCYYCDSLFKVVHNNEEILQKLKKKDDLTELARDLGKLMFGETSKKAAEKPEVEKEENIEDTLDETGDSPEVIDERYELARNVALFCKKNYYLIEKFCEDIRFEKKINRKEPDIPYADPPERLVTLEYRGYYLAGKVSEELENYYKANKYPINSGWNSRKIKIGIDAILGRNNISKKDYYIAACKEKIKVLKKSITIIKEVMKNGYYNIEYAIKKWIEVKELDLKQLME